jgi:hypothetical protein
MIEESKAALRPVAVNATSCHPAVVNGSSRVERSSDEREQFLTRRTRLETLLTQVLTAEQLHLSPDLSEQIREWIDNYEFGLAFEDLEDAFRTQSITPSEPSIEAMIEAAELMGM